MSIFVQIAHTACSLTSLHKNKQCVRCTMHKIFQFAPAVFLLFLAHACKPAHALPPLSPIPARVGICIASFFTQGACAMGLFCAEQTKSFARYTYPHPRAPLSLPRKPACRQRMQYGSERRGQGSRRFPCARGQPGGQRGCPPVRASVPLQNKKARPRRVLRYQ